MRISLEQALDILMDHVTQGRTERKPLEQCLGLVLSQDVFALLDMPPFSRSAQDGYAFQAKDSAGDRIMAERNPADRQKKLKRLSYVMQHLFGDLFEKESFDDARRDRKSVV